ncbi:zinc transporter ZIP6 [Trichomycterus rosablanca]|uniref:zinc transporter ZIP6 n=1 Tax=Trichomycterus rosablanca TaxID=2290929 RepID=UPI002F359A07
MLPAWLRGRAVLSPVLIWTCLSLVGINCSSVAVDTDLRLAEQAQQQHLHTLFMKYGENGTISMSGLLRLLKGLGLDRVRRVTVQHHGNHHNHTHLHTHSHTPMHKHTMHAQPVANKKDGDDSGVKSDSDTHDSIFLKKSQVDAHHNLYIKKAPDSTALLTTPSYVTKSHPANLPEDSSQLNTTHSNHTYYTEEMSTRHLDYHSYNEREISLNYSKQCQNATMILQTHGMSQQTTLSVQDFSFLCPGLILQLDSQSCLQHAENQSEHGQQHGNHCHHHHHHGSAINNSQKSSSIEIAWIGGFLSITIISLLAVVGLVLIPVINKNCFNFLLSFLVALAVGTLSGDALLHLIPHAQGGHKHHHAAGEGLEHDSHGEGEDSLKAVWTGLTALGGVYVMFLTEHFLTLAKMYKDKKQKEQKMADLTDENMESQHLSPPADRNLKPVDEVNGHSLPEAEVMLSQGDYTDEECENKCHSHFHDTVGQSDELHHHHHNYHHILHHHHSQNHHPHTHTHRHTQSYSVQHFKHAGVATLAWMVIMGDGLHNFSDGLAIGAAFTEGLSSGLSTSVAVFCHELPHELGDFAVLLKAGMSVKQAILYNLLSAMMGYLGMIIGILIGHFAENVATWIFALTAGLFLYVALVDMVPEMLHNDASEAGFSHCGFFVLQNAGILLGFGIMLIIAIFEDKIQLAIEL